jgi:hypothetical protein
VVEPLGVTSERLFQFGLVEPLEDAAHRRVGWRPPQGCARRKAAPGKAAFRRPSRRSIKVWICRYERAPLTIARIENRITPACPYILPSARRRSGMAVRQVRRSVVIRNLRVGLLAMDSDRLPLRKRKDVLHGAVRAVPLRHSVEQPWLLKAMVTKPPLETPEADDPASDAANAEDCDETQTPKDTSEGAS